MVERKFNHKEIEPCAICKKEIQTDIANWATIIEYKGKNKDNIKFYHTSCLRDLLEANYGIMAKNFSAKINQLTAGLLQRKGIPQFN